MGILGPEDRIVDLGVKTLERYSAPLSAATSIAVLGPLGSDGFNLGTRRILQAVSDSRGFSVVCQPSLHSAMGELTEEQAAGFSFISTAGQGFIDALCGQFLPTVEALRSA